MSVFTEKLDFLMSWTIDYVDFTHVDVVIVPPSINLNLNQNPLYTYIIKPYKEYRSINV